MCHVLSIRYYKGLFEKLSIGYNTSVELARFEVIYRDAWFKRRICIVSEYRELCIVLEDIGYSYQAGKYLGFEYASVCLIIFLKSQTEVTGMCGIM